MNRVLPWHIDALKELRERRDRLPHALLLHGQQGIGKLRFAVALAEELLCEAPGTEGSCGSCAACAWLAAGSHPDFRRLEPASHEEAEEEGASAKKSMQIVVEQVRAMSDFLAVSTHRGGWRPVIIHPAEALNPSAANALLKNLEEPPPRTLFILVAHRLHQVLPTIKSRCQLLALPSPTLDEASAWLASQGVADARLASAYCGGAPLAAVDVPAENYWEQRGRLVAHLARGRFDPLGAAEDCQDAAYAQVLSWLQKWTYDVAACALTGIVRYNVDHDAAIRRIAAGSEAILMLRVHREFVKLQRHAHHPLNARLALEQLLMSYQAAVGTRPGLAA